MVAGEDRILYLKISGTYVAIGCLTSNSFSETADILGTTTRDNAGWRTIRPTNQSYSISFSGIQFVGQSLGYTQLKELKRDRTLIDWKLEATDAGFVDYGRGYLIDLSEAADVGDYLTFEGTLQGYGKPVELSDNTAPTAPVLGAPTLFSDYVYLSWTASVDDVGVAGYEIRIVSTDGSSETIDIGLPTTFTPEYLDFGVATGFSYSYNVRGYDVAGNVSPWSNLRTIAVTIADSDPILAENGSVLLTENRNSLEIE